MARSEALAVDAACLTGVEDLLTLGDFNEPVPWQLSVGYVRGEHGFFQVVLLQIAATDALPPSMCMYVLG